MDKLQIQLLEYSFKVLSEIMEDQEKTTNKSFNLVYKSEDDLFTASTLKYNEYNGLEFYILSDATTSYYKKFTPGSNSIFRKVRSIVFDANREYNALISLTHSPELLLNKMINIVNEILNNNEDTKQYPFILHNYKSLINGVELDFISNDEVSFKPISLLIR